MTTLPRIGKQFVDDRGNPATFRIGQTGGDADAQMWAEDPLVKDIVERNRSANEKPTWNQRYTIRTFVLTVLPPLCVIALLFLVLPIFFPKLPKYVTYAGLFAVLWLWGQCWLALYRGGPSLPLRRTLLNSCRCAACGYQLDGVPVASDATVECPECAAAWRAEDVHRGCEALGGGRPVELAGKIRGQFTQRAAVIDGRERLVWLLDLWGSSHAPASMQVEDPRALEIREAVRAARKSGLYLRVLDVCAGLFFLGVMGIGGGSWLVTMNVPVPPWASVLVQVVVFLVVCCIVVPYLWRSCRGQGADNKDAVVAALVRVQACASCGQDLIAIDPHPDGCIVCPNCRAAWPMSKWRISGSPERAIAQRDRPMTGENADTECAIPARM